MPFVAAPNIIEVEFRYLLFGQQCENRLMINNLATVDAAALEATAIACWNWWETSYAPTVSSTCRLVEVVATDQSASDGGQFTYAPDSTTTGTGGTTSMPNEVSMCVSLRSTARGRSARGRWYMAGMINTALVDANTITTTYAGLIVTALQTLINDIATGGQEVTIVSYISGGAPRVGGPVYYPVVSALLVDNIVDSMRRRKPGVGS